MPSCTSDFEFIQLCLLCNRVLLIMQDLSTAAGHAAMKPMAVKLDSLLRCNSEETAQQWRNYDTTAKTAAVTSAQAPRLEFSCPWRCTGDCGDMITITSCVLKIWTQPLCTTARTNKTKPKRHCSVRTLEQHCSVRTLEQSESQRCKKERN